MTLSKCGKTMDGIIWGRKIRGRVLDMLGVRVRCPFNIKGSCQISFWVYEDRAWKRNMSLDTKIGSCWNASGI